MREAARQNLIGSDQPADISGIHILLSHMDTIGIHFQCQLHIVIDEQGNTVPGTQNFKLLRLSEKILPALGFLP